MSKKTTTYWDERWIGGKKWSDDKIKIARRVVEHYFEEGDSVILDAGSSLTAVAYELRETNVHIDKRLTILTHNMGIFDLIKIEEDPPTPFGYNFILAGGRYDRDLHALFGKQTVNSYENFYPKKIVIGVSGIRFDEGLFCRGNTEEIPVKEILFAKPVKHRIIVCDYKKIGERDSFRFGKMNEILNAADECTIITNSPPKSATADEKRRFTEQLKKLKDNFPAVKIDIV
jgi:DeoR/GlpR family transcriptional regulator of sugar metabolism